MIENERSDVGIMIKSAGAAIKRALGDYFRKNHIDEITASHGYILCYLSDNAGKDIYQKDIEARFSIGRSAVATALGAMEKNGYITRSSVDSDARLKKLTITEKGIRTHIQITNVIRDFEKELECGLSEEEIGIFSDIIGRIRRNAENCCSDQCR